MNNSKKLSQNALEDFLNKIETSSINNKKLTKKNSQQKLTKQPVEEFLSEISSTINDLTKQNNNKNCVKNCQCKNKNTKCQDCFENNCMLQSYRQGILDSLNFCNQPTNPTPAPTPNPTPEPVPEPEDQIETKTLPISDPITESISETAPNQQIVNEEFTNSLTKIEANLKNCLQKIKEFINNFSFSEELNKTSLIEVSTTINTIPQSFRTPDLYDYDVLEFIFCFKGDVDKWYYTYSFGPNPNMQAAFWKCRLYSSYYYDYNNIYSVNNYWWSLGNNTTIKFDVSAGERVNKSVSWEIKGIKF